MYVVDKRRREMELNMRLFDDILADWRRYGESYAKSNGLKFYITHPGAKLSLRYRVYEWLVSKNLRILAFLVRLSYHRQCTKCACGIPIKVKIGRGICFPHPFSIVVNSNVVIGNNVTILSGVVIGKTDKGIPTIEDDVYIGANACVIGNIIVGKGATIGAGAVVTKDVLPNHVVAGNPAKVICQKKERE